MKKRVPIDELLTWAYRDELPKQSVGGLTGWERVMYLGTSVDEQPSYSRYPVALGDPHPDALRLEWHVRQLEPVAVGWSFVREHLVPELASYVTGTETMVHTVARQVTHRHAAVDHYLTSVVALRTSPRALVEMHARLGNQPDWDVGPVRLKKVVDPRSGKPKVVGEDGGARTRDAGNRLLWGTSCPLELDPAIETIAEARFERVVWHTALMQLFLECRDLKDHEALPPRARQRPWVRWTGRIVSAVGWAGKTKRRPQLTAVCA